MRTLKILIIIVVLILSAGSACAAENLTGAMDDDSYEILESVEDNITADDGSNIQKTAQNDICAAQDDSFTSLSDEIDGKDAVVLTHDYKFSNQTDSKTGILIGRDNFVLNGNGSTIDAKNQSRIFNITADNVTLTNLLLVNGNAEIGGAIFATGKLTLNNVTFKYNWAARGGAVLFFNDNATLNCSNTRFIDNYASEGASIYGYDSIFVSNSYVTSNVFSKRAQICFSGELHVENVTFINISSSYAPALFSDDAASVHIINSRFINLTANTTAGAIGVKNIGELYIKGCEFINVTSSKNAGAVLADIAGMMDNEGNATIIDTVFKDCHSAFGGAYLQLGGNLTLTNTEFTRNHAIFNGGAVYLSYTQSAIENCTFTSNGVERVEDYPTCGGAIFSDMSTLNIDKSEFASNFAGAGNAVYAYDTSYDIKNSIFKNNTNALFSVFDKQCSIDDSNILNNDTVSLNNTFYATIMAGEGMQLELLNNTINVTVLPSRFDLRDWGWVTPVRDQGWRGSCWTFGMTSALESALLKAAGVYGDFSENNMQNTMLRYSVFGINQVEGAFNTVAASYLLSWLGAFKADTDSYDELGKISPAITTFNDIHIQDVKFTANEIPDITQLKLAIMNYGAFSVSYFGQSSYNEENPYYNPDTYAQYVDVFTGVNHEVSVVGWDDTFSKDNFLITPPGDGAWIVKNSWSTDWGDNGYLYVSYYDQSFAKSLSAFTHATSIIIENTVPYNKNYQYDMAWAGDFTLGDEGNNVSYCSVFEAVDDDLIAAVGTFFRKSSVNYKVEIYVNDELKLTQTGLSPYYGYHTVKLNEYVSIKKGDVFKAVITSDCMPVIYFSDIRMHYTENISYSCFDAKTWKDNYFDGVIACLKVYTVADDSKIINNRDITVNYAGGSFFTVEVAAADGHKVAGAGVKFTINGKTTSVKTDNNGIAKIKITDVPKKYTITTTFNGKSVKNTVTIKQVLKTTKVTVKKTAKKFSLKATLKINGKLVKGKLVTFKFNGKTYKVKTNSKGIAQKTLNKKVIKKLKKGKTYTVKVTYIKDTIKTKVIVK